MSSFSDLVEIEQFILQMNQKPNTSPQANQAPINPSTNYIGQPRIVIDKNIRYPNPPQVDPRTEQTNLRQNISLLQAKLNEKDRNRAQLTKALSVTQTNINNKIDAIQNQLNYNKERIEKIKTHNFERNGPYTKFINQHNVLIEDTRHYFQKLQAIEGSVRVNQEKSVVEGSANPKRSTSKSKAKSPKGYGQVLFPQTPKLKKSRAKPFHK